ncbi:LysR family transcriptional regulator [Vibrio sp. SCSIO 43137]|uniref:LysR family transcriptional regulator n=1 Tax=Vibrio sp. SCSIO 43137 TaxID=3021011 RepID=UPI0023070A3A|nr:LysR family transcriptional regulator [Vibrio sp. SCSIO 43137]WCE32541.1 LysR family transcriptional regulator [Vibrio sp. SCSIO 43137]
MTPFPNLPNSHNALKVFESVARLLSFTHAADELHVTQSAVSRQVKQLEDELNVQLIVRKHRAIELTLAGQELYALLNKSFHSLESLFHSWNKPEKKKIVIKSALSYAIRSLIPKMQVLNAKFPDTEIVIIPTMDEEQSIRSDEYDLLIFNSRVGSRYHNQADIYFLRDEYMAPVYSSNMSEKRMSLEEIVALPRLHPTTDHHDWKNWLGNMGIQDTYRTSDTTFYSLDLALSACAAGQGATVTDLLLILPELEREFLICPSGAPIHYSAWKYFFHRRTQSPEVDQIISWLTAETEQELVALRRLGEQHHWCGVISAE